MAAQDLDAERVAEAAQGGLSSEQVADIVRGEGR